MTSTPRLPEAPPRARVTVLDGPVGTELNARGVPTPLPLWSAGAIASAPGTLADVHRAYASAGAQVHTANTFRAQPRWMGSGFEAAVHAAVGIARAAVGPGSTLAGSLAPIEDCYRPDLSPGEGSRADHRRLANALVEAGSDLLLCETFPHCGEAWVAVEECVRTGLPTWLALTAGPSATLMTPEAMRHAAAGAVERGASCVLVNCTPAPQTLAFVEALATLNVPVGAYANAGHADDAIGWQADQVPGAARYAEYAAEWIQAGATVVGGCCGTGPDHTRALAQRFAPTP